LNKTYNYFVKTLSFLAGFFAFNIYIYYLLIFQFDQLADI